MKNKTIQQSSISLILDRSVLKCFADFIELYGLPAPLEEEIRDYIESKLIEKEIEMALNMNLITKEEFYHFLFGHLFTKFICHKTGPDIATVKSKQDKIEARLTKLFFKK